MKGIWEEILGQKTKAFGTSNASESDIGIEQILGMRLSELSRLNLALRINAEGLGCETWLCSNEKIANQLMKDDPGAMIYTADEMRRLYKLKLSPEDLGAIHNAKAVFYRSRIVNSKLKEDGDESDGIQRGYPR